MRKRLCAVAASAVLGSLAIAPSASAHQGHASCAGAAHTFIVPLAQSGAAGKTASAQAQAGTLNENVAAAHAALCEPKG